MEKGLFVHLLGPIVVAHKDDLHVAILAREENVEQHVKALRQILHVLRHRTRHVHKAEHNRACDRPRHVLVSAIADIKGINVGNPAQLGSERLDIRQEL